MSMHLSKTEQEVMEHFWETEGRHTFAELLSYFNGQGKDWKKQTLNTFLSHLIERGLLKKQKENRKTYYSMRLSRKEYRQKYTREILDEDYEGKITNFIAALTGDNSITENDEKELIEYLRNK